jgi:hypothetical protein
MGLSGELVSLAYLNSRCEHANGRPLHRDRGLTFTPVGQSKSGQEALTFEIKSQGLLTMAKDCRIGLG